MAGTWNEVLRLRRPASRFGGIHLLAQLVFVGLTGGLSLGASLSHARPHLEPELAAELDRLLRRGQHVGLAGALASSEGEARRFYTVLARAHVTGAPLAPAVAAFLDEERQAQRARAVEEARKLPVKLLVPLALLILPGFVLLTVGPSLVTSLKGVLGPFTAVP